jgi:hypothetical protein
MRVNQEHIRSLSATDNDIDAMTFLRAMKDTFKPKKL